MADHLIHEMSASVAAAQIRSGSLSCEALMQACLARVVEREPQVGAWQFIDPKRALAQAREADLR